MFYGSAKHKLDEVGRCIFPKRFRFSLGERFIITRGIGCLLVLTSEQFQSISQRARGLGDPLTVLFNPDVGRIYRHLFGEMVEVSCDSQGRIQLTPELREYAGIDKDVVMIGVTNWIEIWGAENWEDYKRNNLTPEQLMKAAEASFAKDGGEVDGGVSSPDSA